jgi:hypothetical protein
MSHGEIAGGALCCIALLWSSWAQTQPTPTGCDGWSITQRDTHVSATRQGWSARGARLEQAPGRCVLEGEARLVGERRYVSAGELELGVDHVVAPRGAQLFEGSSRWSASRLVLWFEDGRVELEGISPVGRASREDVEEVSR